MRTTLLLTVGTLLGACAAAPPPEPMPRDLGGKCVADSAQHLVGSKASGETGAELLRLTGATALRWVPPRTAVTMDFRADRLTVSYDDDLTITRISCT